jgi:pimeloyl-ACP methyl ester carboxylesterase
MRLRHTVIPLFILCAVAHAAESPIFSRNVGAGANQLHYLTAGRGPAVILLHGYAETSRMWRPLMPRLADRFMVIAPDLPGIGDSAIPARGMDMKTAAQHVHALAQSLGIKKAEVVGHDIGLMVAYAYAALYPAEVEKLVVMDAFLPGVGEGDAIYNDPGFWHFRFHGPTPEKLVRGRERTYFEHYWNDFAADKNHSIPEIDRRAYTVAYSRPGRMRSAWLYFASFPRDAQDFAAYAQTKLTMPILSIGGEKSLGDALGRQMKIVGTNVEVIIITNSGHWLMEERPQQTMDALLKFL